jgi:hypothetical protein
MSRFPFAYLELIYGAMNSIMKANKNNLKWDSITIG